MTPDAPTDDELVTETLAGNSEAFGKLYDWHARIARAVVAGVSGDWSAADDMVQECFLRSYRKLATLRDRSQFRSWLVGIARSVGRERRRTLGRARHEFRALTEDESISSVNVAAEAEQRECLESVVLGIAQLPEQERVAIHAFFLEQRNAEHGASVLGLSRSGFYAVLQRAIARLATKVAAPTEGGRRVR